MQEVITWKSVDDEMPDSDITVLVACGHPANESLDVFEAFLDAEKGGWSCPDGCVAQHVRFWAEMPGGPQV
jgi:hypothetical protein